MSKTQQPARGAARLGTAKPGEIFETVAFARRRDHNRKRRALANVSRRKNRGK